MTRLLRILCAVGLVVAGLAHPAAAASPVSVSPVSVSSVEIDDLIAATRFSADEFLDLFETALLPGLAPIGPAPAITGDASFDARIRAIGEARGYRRWPEPSRPLVAAGGFRLQPEAAAAWESLRVAAAGAGHTISLTAGYRESSRQASILRSRINGTSDAAIDAGLQTAAMPGYSRHHTGYAIDLRSSAGGGFALRNTAFFAWLSADNFANAKLHGWIPSYPDGSRPTGPVPEPWEFVWVGRPALLCADYTPTADRPFCDTIGAPFEAEIRWLVETGATSGCTEVRYCAADPTNRAEAATFIWRLAGRPAADGPADVEVAFTDVPPGAYFAQAIQWMVASGITNGTSTTTFSPEVPLNRAQFVTLLWRTSGSPPPMGEPPVFNDVDPTSFAAAAIDWAASVGVTNGTTATTFAPGDVVDRSQVAALLQRYRNTVPLEAA